jgi:glutaredoxin
MPHHIVLYTKPGCHLCEDALRWLYDLRGEFDLTIAEIDITTDAALLQNYFDKIPVLRIDDRVTLAAPINRQDVRAVLSSLSSLDFS